MAQHYIAHVQGETPYALYVLDRDGLTRRFLEGETYASPRDAIDQAKDLDARRQEHHITPGDDEWDDLDEPAETIDEPKPETKDQRRKRLAKERREGRR